MNKNTMKLKKFLDKCNEFSSCKLLYIDKKISELLEVVAETKEIYELVSECLENFNKEKEYDKAFITDSNGRHFFLAPKEEYKTIALDFCLMADVASGKKSVDSIISNYFAENNGKKDYEQFIEKIIFSFRDLVAEVFGVTPYAINFMSKNDLSLNTEENVETYTDIVNYPIERVSVRLFDDANIGEVFNEVRNLAKEMLENLRLERRNEFVNDAELVCHSMMIACLNQDFDSLHGLVLSFKYLGKNIKSIRFLTKEIVALVQEQIYWEKEV